MKYNEALSKLKEKNKILNKERQQLDYKIAKFKKEQNEYEQKNMNLTQYILNYENNVNKFNAQENIDKNNKEIFYNLNYYISTGYNIPLGDNINIHESDKNNQILLTGSNELIDSLNL
jgi:septal ring factor EnvC (AmiA/AmiB activator)